MTEPINIIFLDVDGVLNSLPYCQTTPIGSYVDISEDNLRNLAVLYRETQAQIVLSSTWRELKDAGHSVGTCIRDFSRHSAITVCLYIL